MFALTFKVNVGILDKNPIRNPVQKHEGELYDLGTMQSEWSVDFIFSVQTLEPCFKSNESNISS